MTPLEVNKKIAELKGLKVDHTYKGDECIKVLQDGRDSLFMRWTTTIYHAWELFEEMPFKMSVGKYAKKNYFIAKWEDAFATEPTILVEAATVPMAICLAYIAWKEKECSSTKK